MESHARTVARGFATRLRVVAVRGALSAAMVTLAACASLPPASTVAVQAHQVDLRYGGA